MRKLSKANQRAWTLNYLKVHQNGICPLCKLPISTSKTEGRSTDWVLDHRHDTGEVRGVLHRSCNASLGKMDNAIGRWGAKSMQYDNIISWLENALAYYRKEGTGVMYATHKTAEELHAAELQKRRVQRARAKARQAVKE